MTDPVAVNTLVRLDFGGDVPLLASRVEDLDGHDVLLAAAAAVGVTALPQPGATLNVRWTGTRGLCCLPVEFRSIERSGQVRLWRVRPLGGVDVRQRRRFARVSAGGAISLEAQRPEEADAEPVPGESGHLMGWMLDIGEGGVRLRAAGVAPQVGTSVVVRVTLDGELVQVAGDVVALRPAHVGMGEVVVGFAGDERFGDRIRRFVMERQLQERRAGLR